MIVKLLLIVVLTAVIAATGAGWKWDGKDQSSQSVRSASTSSVPF